VTATHATTDAAPRPAEAAPRRDAFLDNAKFLLIALVVIGHAINPLRGDTAAAEALYTWIYLFHMPAFVLIAGYLSKSFDGSGARVEKLLATVAVPYLIFWGIYVLQAMSADRAVPPSPLEPIWITWFLAALLVWRLSVPLWKRIRWPILVSLGVSLGVAVLVTGDVLGMSRILSLLPFFVVGLFLQPHHFEVLRQPWVRVLSAIVILATIVLSYAFLADLSAEWVYWRTSLEERDVELLPLGLPARVVFLGLAAVLTAAFLSLVPRRRTWFTAFGVFTMYVFLLHGLPIRIGQQLGWYEWVDGLVGLGVVIALSVAATFLLASRPVRAATRWAVEPRASWIVRPGELAGSSEPTRRTP
jgi:fucose 4-O-acetylase-like acetyltransferase